MQTISLEQLIARYDTLLFDAYGVLIHNSGALPGASELINRLNRIGKPYLILTNDASRLATTASARYQRYGLAIPPERILSAGSLLTDHFQYHHLTGKRCLVLGPEDSRQLVANAGGQVVTAEDDFEVLVVADEMGYPLLETIDAALSTLCRRLDQNLPLHLILPNPDLIYPKASGFGITAGSIAMILEAALQLRYPGLNDLHFIRLGKPHAAIFLAAQARSPGKLVMIGDQLETDIRGAQGCGIASVLVCSGITPRTSPFTSRPDYVIDSIAALL
ncbi:MAG: HAD hydrolase-like protein [Gammaproteobacteria bacterium]|nr:HAD hydrolase-like protein [Gammaproteobacteria bacterium]